MNSDKLHPQENNFPDQQIPLRLIEQEGPREKSKTERPEADRDEIILFYDRPIYKAKKYLLF